MRTIYFTTVFSSITSYLTAIEATSYNVSPFSFQAEIVPFSVFLQRSKNSDPLLFIVDLDWVHDNYLKENKKRIVEVVLFRYE